MVSLKEQIDTSTPIGRFLVSVFTALAQLEREQILTRQKEGIAAQKTAGTYTGGHPRVRVDQKLLNSVMARWKTGEITEVQAMKELSVTKATFYRLAKSIPAGKCFFSFRSGRFNLTLSDRSFMNQIDDYQITIISKVKEPSKTYISTLLAGELLGLQNLC